MYDVITFGSATLDVFMVSKNLKVVEDEKFITKKGLCVPLGSKLFMDSVRFDMGGTGTNTAVTFARQGLKTTYLGLIGKDSSGQGIKDELTKHQVDLEMLQETEQWPTAYSVIISLPQVGRSILKKTGACHQITEQDILFDQIKAKWLYLGSLSGASYKIVKPVVEFAKENNIKIAINPVGDMQLTEGIEELRSILDKIDVVILNQEESAILAGLDIEKEEEIFKKLDDLVKGIVVMTKGSEGVIVSDGHDRYSAGIPESGLVDRTGAGDAFSAAFVSGLIEKDDIVYAIQLGTANATAVLQEIGAVNGLLKKGDWGPWDKVEVKK